MANKKDSEPINEDFDDGWVRDAYRGDPQVVAQRVLRGDPFQKGLPIQHGDSELSIPQERRVGVVAGVDGVGRDFFIAERDVPNVHPSDFPNQSLSQADTLFDLALEGSPSLRTVRKGGASTAFVNTDAAIETRGGDPRHRIKQPNFSFAYKPGSLGLTQ